MTTAAPTFPPLSGDTIEAFRQALPKLLVFVNDKFLLENRFQGSCACGHAEVIEQFNRAFSELLLGVYCFSLYDQLPLEFPGYIAMLESRGIARGSLESLLKAWIIGIQCLVRRPASGKLIPPLEWLLAHAAALAEQAAEAEPPLAEPVRNFFDLLAAKNRKFAAEHILSLIREGRSIEDAYTLILLPALSRIRLLWRKNALSAADEHTAEDICRYVMFRVVDSIFGERRYPFKALVACIQGEENILNAEVFASFLEIKGWSVSFIGHDAPEEDIIHAVATGSPQVVVLSVASVSRLPVARDLLQQLRTRFPEVKIVTEGPAVLLARAAFEPLGNAVISGFEQGHAAMLNLVIPDA